MAMSGGTEGRGRRTVEETPDVPDASELSELERRAQRALIDLVEQVGGRWGLRTTPILVGDLEDLSELLDAWARRYASRGANGKLCYGGRPGLWHALDALVPAARPEPLGPAPSGPDPRARGTWLAPNGRAAERNDMDSTGRPVG